MYSVKSTAQLLSRRYIHRHSFVSYDVQYEETGFQERCKTFWRICWMARGIGACDVVFVL